MFDLCRDKKEEKQLSTGRLKTNQSSRLKNDKDKNK